MLTGCRLTRLADLPTHAKSGSPGPRRTLPAGILQYPRKEQYHTNTLGAVIPVDRFGHWMTYTAPWAIRSHIYCASLSPAYTYPLPPYPQIQAQPPHYTTGDSPPWSHPPARYGFGPLSALNPDALNSANEWTARVAGGSVGVMGTN